MQPIIFFAVMMFVTGLIYPLAVTTVVQFTFPQKSNGSLVFRNQKIIGSELIAQDFKSSHCFHTRPASDSASQIDPHITREMAEAQIKRIAEKRNVSSQKIQNLLADSENGLINVLLINLMLDEKLQN